MYINSRLSTLIVFTKKCFRTFRSFRWYNICNSTLNTQLYRKTQSFPNVVVYNTIRTTLQTHSLCCLFSVQSLTKHCYIDTRRSLARKCRTTALKRTHYTSIYIHRKLQLLRKTGKAINPLNVTTWKWLRTASRCVYLPTVVTL